MSEEPTRSIIRSPGTKGNVQLEYVPGVIRVHSVPEYQLEGLAAGSTPLAFGGACAVGGAFLTALASLLTVEMGVYVFAGFVATLISTGILTLYFGAIAIRDHRKTQKRLADIKAGRITYPDQS